MLAVTFLVALLGSAHAALKTCRARDLPAIDVFGLEVIDIQTKEQHNYEDWGLNPERNPPLPIQPIDFCNVTITYTHPGQNDSINVYIWLPLEGWNGRLLGQGGGGWAAGSEEQLPSGIVEGYVTANTDAGHTYFGDISVATQGESWGFLSPGNIHWVLLQDFAARALDDLPKIAKQVIEGFYGKPVKHSYWNGCSTGGRQGMMSAQRFATNYDGILAAAPAINWATFVTALSWPQLQMHKVGYYPPQCEFDAITQAAIEGCDELDGVKDGVVAAPGLCRFDAISIVGQSYACEGNNRKVTKEAAEIMNAIWSGPRHNGGLLSWYGLTHETAAAGPTPFSGLASTTCDADNKNCKGWPFPITESWIQYFVRKDPNFNASTMSEEDFWSVLRQSRNEFTSIMDASDPDLSEFRAAGGKMISWHGLADQLIPPNGTSNYYERVLALDSQAPDYYRHFEAPGVAHCTGGPGAFPGSALKSLIDWVENGIAPDKLDATFALVDGTSTQTSRILCPYPQVAAYTGGDTNDAASFECADSFNVAKRHAEL